ncbi:MAG: CBS domain-containing protein [Candidatus Altiarchaeota archaeon]
MLVKDVMSKRLIMIGPREMVFAAVKLMVANNISGVVVEEGKKAVGIITMKDIIRRVVANERDIYGTQVSEVMSSPVQTINQLTALERAASWMGEHKIKRLVAVDDKNKAVGIVTVMDIVSKLPEMVDVMFQTWVKPDWR